MQQLFSILQQVDSTNNYAMAAIRNGLARDGSCWFAAHQTGGKGQRGKIWETEAGRNVAMSIAIKPKATFIHNLFVLNALVALEVRDLCETCTDKAGFTIKWPNDIYFGDKKAAGILLENIFSNNKVTDCVVGVGINVNQTSFSINLPNATSLRIVSGNEFVPVDLAKQLHENIIQSASTIVPEELIERYNFHLYKRGKQVKLRSANAAFTTTIQSVSNFGQLITKDVIERSFNFGEVIWEF